MLVFSLALVLVLLTTCSSQQPNIIFILTDDQGWYDMGYRASDVITPHMDELAGAGVKLENHYVQPICTPSRSVLMTGRYQVHTGMQNGLLWTNTMFGVPLETPLISEKLKELGYSTHMMGKWHLGFYKPEYTPAYRGFDTFYGFYLGGADHYRKTFQNGYDMHFDVEGSLVVDWNNTEYSTIDLANRAVEIIRNHDGESPLFLYLPVMAPHTPVQAPQVYIDMYDWMEDGNRKIYNAMMTCLDDAVRNITDALKERNWYDNTVIIYTSDNGGPGRSGSSNWPWRGGKGSYYQGGMKTSAWISSPLIQVGGTVNNEYIHISDWYPTLVHLAGGDVGELDVDGINQWETIAYGQPSERTEILLNINPLVNPIGENTYPDIFDVRVQAGIIWGDYKLLTGNHGYPDLSDRPPLPPGSNLPKTGYEGLYDAAEKAENHPTRAKRQAEKNLWLYDVANDPIESNDLSEEEDNYLLIETMLLRLRYYNETAWEAADYDELADPEYNPGVTGGAYYPWM